MKPERTIQRLKQRFIPLVDVVFEQYLPVVKLGCQIDHQHRQRPGQKYRFGLTRANNRINFSAIPAGNVPQKQFGQLKGARDREVQNVPLPEFAIPTMA